MSDESEGRASAPGEAAEAGTEPDGGADTSGDGSRGAGSVTESASGTESTESGTESESESGTESESAAETESESAAESVTASETEAESETASASASRTAPGAAASPNPLYSAPPLALLAAWFALLDLCLNRLAVRVMSELMEPESVLAWQRAGVLPRNIAGVAGLGALGFGLIGFLAMPGFAPIWVRLPVAAFAGVLTPTLTLATFLPRERMAPTIIVFGLMAAQALGVIIAANALPYRARALRVALTLAVGTCLATTIVVVISTIRALAWSDFGTEAVIALRHVGEIGWLLMPLAAAPLLFAIDPPRERPALAAGLVTALLVVTLGMAGEGSLHPHYSTILYGAFRVALLPESATLVYTLPLALGFGATVTGLCSGDAARRQLGAALAFWLAGGYAGRSPIQLLYGVLAIILLARVAQSLDPEGVRRSRLRWTPRGLRPPLGEER